uniref:Uncharacterized protein n=1 Tax=Solanum lycopersicum TaxID=4081 RepID=A0A494G8A8_SOLLC
MDDRKFTTDFSIYLGNHKQRSGPLILTLRNSKRENPLHERQKEKQEPLLGGHLLYVSHDEQG